MVGDASQALWALARWMWCFGPKSQERRFSTRSRFTAVRTVAQISILSIDSEHNSLGLRGTASGRDGRMDDSHDGQTSWLAAFLSGDLEPGDARVPRANTSPTPRHRRVCRRSSQWCAPWPRIQKIFSYTPSRVVAFRGSDRLG